MPFLKTDDFISAFKFYPPSVVAPYRRQRTYLNKRFSTNELLYNNPYNWTLFIRVSKGHYFLNPALEIEIAKDEWKNIYELSGLMELSSSPIEVHNKLAEILIGLKDEVIKIFTKSDKEKKDEAVEEKPCEILQN
jgi:hypothetical protein